MTFRGNLLLYTLWYELHPFENLRRKASLPRPDAPVLGRTQNFYRVLGKKFCGLFIYPGQSVRQVVAVSAPGDRDSYGCVAPAGNEQGPAATTESACAKRRCLTSRRPFAGMPGAQATARQGWRDRNGRCKPGVFTHRTVATARNRASGFGGDWRVRQQLPVGVGPDDRMPPGSREPKVRPADRTTLQ